MSKSRQRIWHCHHRAFDRYSSILTHDDIKIHIPKLIIMGGYTKLSFDDLPKHKRNGNCLYGIVNYKGKDFSFILDKISNELKTFLPHTFNLGYLGELFSDYKDIEDIKYIMSKIFIQLQFELERLPTEQEVVYETGLESSIIKSLSPNN